MRLWGLGGVKRTYAAPLCLSPPPLLQVLPWLLVAIFERGHHRGTRCDATIDCRDPEGAVAHGKVALVFCLSIPVTSHLRTVRTK